MCWTLEHVWWSHQIMRLSHELLYWTRQLMREIIEKVQWETQFEKKVIKFKKYIQSENVSKIFWIKQIKWMFTYHFYTYVNEWITLQEWPTEGVVEFKKFSTRYRKGLDLVVKNIDLTIGAGKKVRHLRIINSIADNIIILYLDNSEVLLQFLINSS